MKSSLTSEAPKRVVLHPHVAARIAEIVPPYMDLTTFVNHALTGLVDNLTPSPLTIPPSTPTKFNPLVDVSGVEGEVSSERQRATHEGGEGDLSLRAEEAHIPPAALKKIKPTHDVPGCLFPHEDLIRSYWKAKPKTKTKAAWDLLMRELAKIQDNYGDDVVRDQLVLAEAQGFQSITLKNYEQFGMTKSNAPAKAKRGTWEDLTERFGHLNGMSL